MGASDCVDSALAEIVTSSPLTAMTFVPGGIPGASIEAPTPRGPGPAESSRLPLAVAGAESQISVFESAELSLGNTWVMKVPGAMPGPLIDWPGPKAPDVIERFFITVVPTLCVPAPVAVTTSARTFEPAVIVAVPLAVL